MFRTLSAHRFAPHVWDGLNDALYFFKGLHNVDLAAGGTDLLVCLRLDRRDGLLLAWPFGLEPDGAARDHADEIRQASRLERRAVQLGRPHAGERIEPPLYRGHDGPFLGSRALAN